MFVIYFIPLVTYLFLFISETFPKSPYHFLVFVGVVLHFGKRCLEVFFIHKYSGFMAKPSVFLITSAYTSISLSIHQQVNLRTTEGMITNSIDFFTYIGIILFSIGQIGNLYHHILLSKLRTNESKDYKIPSGGLFGLVNCPHYLLEIIAWLGLCIVSKYLAVFGLTFVMSGYLIARSLNTTKWYQEKIPNFPKDRKSIIPYLV